MIGKTVSHYRILEKLGGGGMGVVYKAEDTQLKRTVALKFLPPSLTLDSEAQTRFVHEARAASALDHSNICTIHEIGHTDDGQLFIVMACYEGQTLKKSIEAGPLDIDLALDIVIQIAEGLVRAHEAGIVHRDIKPANIFITRYNEVKILDFGLAKLAGQTMLTKTGSTLGTAAYMSPEQARGEAVDRGTDIWSLGVVLYEMLTGKKPFDSDYEQALVYSILNEHPKPLRESRPEVPEVLDQIIGKAMAKGKEERYQSAQQLLADFRVARGVGETGGTIAAAEAARRTKQRRLIKRAIISIATLAVVLLGLFVVWPMVQDQLLASNPRTIAVISFENQTGDKSQDHLRVVLQEAIITSLEQSKYIRVTTRQRMVDILKQMGKKDVENVDNELGLEICRREGAQLMAVGTIASAGDLYRTTLKLVDVKTLETAKTYTTSGKGVESLLEKQVDDLSREVSRGIGVSQRRTEETIRPVAEIGTTSMEAYQFYIRGMQEFDKVYWRDARRFLELAVQKDSLFAMAWFRLGNALGWLGDEKAMQEAYKKAAALAGRATEKEQWYIAGVDSSIRASLVGSTGVNDYQFQKLCAERYPREKEFLGYWGNTLWLHLNDPDEAIRVLHRALELDPSNGPVLNSLAYAYNKKRDWAKAMETLKRYALASPGDANPYDSMADIYLAQGMLDEAIACNNQALALKPDFDAASGRNAGIYFLKEDYESALRWWESSPNGERDPTAQKPPTYFHAYTAFWQGQLNAAERLLAKSKAMRAAAGQPVRQDEDFLTVWIANERRQFARARQLLDFWESRTREEAMPEHRPLVELSVLMCRGFIDINAGMLDSAAARLARMDSIRARIPASDTSANAKRIASSYLLYSGPLRSWCLLSAGRNQEALTARPQRGPLERASRPYTVFSDAFIPPEFKTVHVMVDIVPRAYLALGQLDSAMATYERAVSVQAAPSRPIFPRYHYRLAQVYERKGLKAKAISEYEKFLKIWGKADPIYKEPADARARLSKLKHS
jgi:serine/threonine protein kinase/Tfp pilus assembly protein PilF